MSAGLTAEGPPCAVALPYEGGEFVELLRAAGDQVNLLLAAPVGRAAQKEAKGLRYICTAHGDTGTGADTHTHTRHTRMSSYTHRSHRN